MTKYCEGCGALLQIEEKEKEGYARNLEHTLCERCFRIRNYNDYKTIAKDNQEFLSLLKRVSETKDLVLLVLDLFHLHPDVVKIAKQLENPILLVLTKRDLLPKTTYNQNLLDYIDRFQLPVVDKIMISSQNNYHFDELYQKILKYKKSNNVYVVGLTNAGKSTMLNQMIYHYGDSKREITTSMLPSTTMNFIEIPMGDQLTLIDTPGILDTGNMVELLDYQTMKKVVPNQEIKPRTYQLKQPQIHVLEKLVCIDYNDINNVTYFVSNKVEIERYYKDVDLLKTLECHEMIVNDRTDVVVSGFGFVKIMKACCVKVYVPKGVLVYTRDALI